MNLMSDLLIYLNFRFFNEKFRKFSFSSNYHELKFFLIYLMFEYNFYKIRYITLFIYFSAGINVTSFLTYTFF